MAKIPCPIPGYDEMGEDGPRYYVTVPDEWLGLHSEAFYQTKKSLEDATIPPDYRSLAFSLTLADDYRLPLLEGKPENWQSEVFPKFPLEVMAWVNFAVFENYSHCFVVKKNWLMPLSGG